MMTRVEFLIKRLENKMTLVMVHLNVIKPSGSKHRQFLANYSWSIMLRKIPNIHKVGRSRSMHVGRQT